MSNVIAIPTAPGVAAEGSAQIATLHLSVDGERFIQSIPQLPVHNAVSCLTAPQQGDRVRFVIDGGQIFILDVLWCAKPERALHLTTHHPELHIAARQISVQAEERLTLQSPELSLLSRSGRWLATTLSQIADKMQWHCRQAERRVSETDSVEAAHILQQAKNSYRLDSELAAINGRTVLKIDGGQVHVG